jgi:hypothetical protein
LKHEAFWKFGHEGTGKVFVVHDTDKRNDRCITCWVVKNLYLQNEFCAKRSYPFTSPGLYPLLLGAVALASRAACHERLCHMR